MSFLLLPDFTKAFDTVNHELMIEKLRCNFCFESSALSLIRSNLHGRLQCVDIDGHRSKFLPVNSGLPQGTILSPLLFSMFINDLPKVLKHCNCHMFADDFQLYYSHPVKDFYMGS